MSLRLGICVWLLLIVGGLTWSIALFCCATYVMYDWPLQVWRLVGGLVVGGICFAGAAALLKEKQFSTFLDCIYQASAMSSLLLVVKICVVWLSYGFTDIELSEILLLVSAMGLLGSYCVLYRRPARRKRSLPSRKSRAPRAGSSKREDHAPQNGPS